MPSNTCARPHDPSITPEDCWKCGDLRGWQVAQGNWIDHKRKDGWLEDNVGSGRYVTKDCDTVRNDGTLIHLREDGYLGNVCPRMDAPCAVASPVPCASPSPSASPTPIPTNAPPLTESGNYPRPAIGTCPPWFQNQPFSMHVKVSCKVKGNGGRRCTLDLTQRSEKPWMEHTCYGEDGSYSLGNCKPVSEMWRGCQEPRYVDYIEDERGDMDPNPGDGIVMTIFHPSWGYYGACDKITSQCNPRNETCPVMTNPRENYRCQDSDDKGERAVGSTKYRVCMPDGTHCVEGVY